MEQFFIDFGHHITAQDGSSITLSEGAFIITVIALAIIGYIGFTALKMKKEGI